MVFSVKSETLTGAPGLLKLCTDFKLVLLSPHSCDTGSGTRAWNMAAVDNKVCGFKQFLQKEMWPASTGNAISGLVSDWDLCIMER